MANLKQDMEDECQKLQENLRHLMDDRSFIQDEFLQLTDLQQKMIVQLREDTLAGEGHLHTFQAEKNRIEERLEQLEEQLKEKNEQLLDLDAKASEYLRKVTTASNNLYDDDDEPSEQNVSQQNLIQKMVNDEMTEHSDDDECSVKSHNGSISANDDVSNKNIPSLDNDDSEGNEGDVSSESVSEVPSDSKPDRSHSVTPPTRDQILSLSNLVTELKRVKDEMGKCITNKDETLLDLEERLRETKRELASLKGSVSDVSFGMRRREEGYYPLDREGSVNRKYELERHVSELQDATGQSSLPHDEKLELLHKIEILESMIDEDNSDLEVDDIMSYDILGRGRSMDSKDFLTAGLLRVRTPSVRSSSAMGNCSISERVALLEKDLAEANEKLHEAHSHMHILAKEKEHKQNECERLKGKVNNVEGKMNELQGTFDALVKTMMEEREQMVKEVEGRKVLMEEIKTKLECEEKRSNVDLNLFIPKVELAEQLTLMEQKYCDELKTCRDNLNVLEKKHADEVLSLKQNKEEMENSLKNSILKADEQKVEFEKEKEKVISELKNNFKTKENEYILKLVRIQKEKDALREESDQMQNEELAELQEKYDQLVEEVSTLKNKELSCASTSNELLEKLETKEKESLQYRTKIESLESEIADFAPRMKEEMNRMKEECNKLAEDKTNLEKTFLALQKELQEVQQKNEELSLKVNQGDGETESMLSLKQQLEDLNCKNLNLTSEMYTKEEESNEELNAREATIQELRITLTNNQKQSRENYQMLQDDIAALNIRFAKEKEELQAIITHLKEKCLKLEEDGQQKQQEVDSLKNALESLSSSKVSCEQTPETPELEDDDDENVETADKATSIDAGEGILKSSSTVVITQEKVTAETEVSVPLKLEIPETQVEYQKLLSEKEDQLSELARKVENLEKQLIKDTAHSTAVESDAELRSRFETQMAQIAELNNFINDLQLKVDDITSESLKLKETVDQLQTEKLQFQSEKKALIEEYEVKLTKAKHSHQELKSELEATKALIDDCEARIVKTGDYKDALEVELETKKAIIAECEVNLTKSRDSQNALKVELEAKKEIINECETKLSKAIDSKSTLESELGAKKSMIDECESKLIKANDAQVAMEAELGAKKNLVEGLNFKLRSVEGSVLDNPCDVEISLIDRLDLLGTFYDKKIRENNEKYLTKINIMEKQILSLKEELDEFQLKDVARTVKASEKLAELESENKQLKEDKKNIIDSYEKEQKEKYLTKINIMEKQILSLKEELDEFQLKDVASTVKVSEKLAELESENKQLKEDKKNIIESYEKEQKEKYLTKINIMEKQILSLKEEVDEFQLKDVANTVKVSRKLAELESENKQLKENKKTLIESHEKEQTDSLNMQNQMVTDLEKLILNLEAEKKELEVELKGAHEQLSSIRKDYEDKILVLRECISMLEKERDVLRMEIARLLEEQPINDDSQGINSNECLSLIEDLTKKVTKLRTKLEEAQASLEEKGTNLKDRLCKERANHRNEMQRLRKDMREEMDILEQQKEDLKAELTAEIKRISSEWSAKLQASEREKELHLMDEKSQFGRVLVGKNDEYEKMVEEKNIVVSGYQSRLADLQSQLEEKSNLIDELETNIEELVNVRENLEEKLSAFKSMSVSSGKLHSQSVPLSTHSPIVKAPKLSPIDPSLDPSLSHHSTSSHS